MAQPSQRDIRNRLLTRLTPEAFGVLQPHLEPVALPLREFLNLPNEPTSHVYFLDEGIASVVLAPERHPGVEVGIVGRDGLVGTSVVLGVVQSPHQAFIQSPGKGWRVPAQELRRAMDTSADLRGLLLAYIHAYLVQLASTAHANADFTVDERLARWILMCHDRADGDDLAMTHEFMALMLGVRRPGVTVATHVLEGERLIRARRGVITVLDREGLKKTADGAYGVAEAEYERVIESPAARADTHVIEFPSGASPKRG